jgi:hypothetical protein
MAPAARGEGMADAGPERPTAWKVVRTDEFRHWVGGLRAERGAQVEAAIRRVETVGPLLGRPHVDSIQGSRVHNLKELRIHDGVRILFAFDPNRRAVMLVGGNKTGRWDRWYRQFIPVAERLYGKHLRSIGKEDPCLSRPRTATSSAARSR